MRSTRNSTRRHRLALTLLFAALLALAPFNGLAEDGYAGDEYTEDYGAEGYDALEDLNGGYVPVTAEMTTADRVIGYVAPAGSAMSPIYCVEWGLVSLSQLIYESVVDLDASLKPVPMLADSWEQDGKTWVFKLRQGIQFHNGMELTAYDVVRSYESLMGSYVNNPWVGRLSAIASMEATDIYNVTVVGTTPGIATLYAMNFPVMQYTTLEDEAPRGTGPYWFIQRDVYDTIRLEANPLWWKRQPLIHSLLFKRYDESGDAIEAIHTGKIDILASQSAKAAFSRKLADLVSMDFLTQTYEVLVPNLNERSIFSDIRARQAVMYAMDRAVVASNAYLDMAVQSEVPVPPTSWLYESQSAYYYYSPERALQLMHELGWYDLTGNGTLNQVNGVRLIEPDLTIITYNESTNSIRENAANLIADYLRAVGISCTVYVRTPERVKQLMKDRNFDLALVGVNLSEIPDLGAMLSRGGSLNLNGFASDEMQAYIEASRSSADENEVRNAFSKIQMFVVEHLPILGLGFRTGTVLSTASLGGMYGLRSYDTFNGLEFVASGG